jgi:hypothetical protein
MILHDNFISYIKNIIYSLFLKHLFTHNLHYGYSLILFITNTEKCIYTKLLYGIIYISICNQNKLYKLLILTYIGTLIINLIKKYSLIKQITNNNIIASKINVNDKIDCPLNLHTDFNHYGNYDSVDFKYFSGLKDNIKFEIHNESIDESVSQNIVDEIKNAMENILDEEHENNENKNNIYDDLTIIENYYN